MAIRWTPATLAGMLHISTEEGYGALSARRVDPGGVDGFVADLDPLSLGQLGQVRT